MYPSFGVDHARRRKELIPAHHLNRQGANLQLTERWNQSDILKTCAISLPFLENTVLRSQQQLFSRPCAVPACTPHLNRWHPHSILCLTTLIEIRAARFGDKRTFQPTSSSRRRRQSFRGRTKTLDSAIEQDTRLSRFILRFIELKRSRQYGFQSERATHQLHMHELAS